MNETLLFGQQVGVPGSKANALRLGDLGASSKSSQPVAERLPSLSGRNKTTTPIETTPSENISLIRAVPKSSSEILIGVELPMSHDVEIGQTDSTENENAGELALPSALAMKIATATMSHVTPFFWWMAGPTSGIEMKDVASNAEGTQPTEADMPKALQELAELSTETGEYEPPSMIIADEPFSETTADALATSIHSPEPTALAVTESPRKSAPRLVRIPFENEKEEEKLASKNVDTRKSSKQSDKDSQQDQEEPLLDPRRNGGERDNQGIDALLASKPIANRREIRIDDLSNEGISVAPIIQSKPLDPVLANRLQRAEACIAFYLNNPESTSVRSPWAVMHALLAFGGDYEMIHGQGRVNAIGWMCHNGTCRTQRMFTSTTLGFKPNVGDGVQGHEGQFLAILAQSNVPLNYPIQIGSSKYTVEDLVRYEMATCKEKTELTFKLIGLSYYLESNKQWRANDGKIWSISKLIQEELAQPIIGAACGGVHRLMGFSFSVRQRQFQGLPINGQYARAAKFVKEYIDYTWQLQNPDGSFSTSWYEGRANEPNEERKVQTSGHMLEWLMYTLSDEEIKNPRVGKSVDFLLTKIYDKRENKWPIGPRGHATRAVALYQARTMEISGQSSRAAPIHSAVKTGVAPTRK